MKTWSDDSEMDAEDEAFLRPWIEAMVKAEIDRTDVDHLWDRIKAKLDELHAIEDRLAVKALLRDVYGPAARMVEGE